MFDKLSIQCAAMCAIMCAAVSMQEVDAGFSIVTRQTVEEKKRIEAATVRILKATYTEPGSNNSVAISGEELIREFPVLLNLANNDIQHNLKIIKQLPFKEIRIWHCPASHFDKNNPRGNLLKASQTVASFYGSGQLARILEIYNDPDALNHFIRLHPNGCHFVHYRFKEGLADITDEAVGSFIREGKQEVFDDRGTLLLEQEFVNGELHGESKSFFPNGELRLVHNFKHGKAHGLCMGYFPSSMFEGEEVVAFTETYENHKLISGEYHGLNNTIMSVVENGKGISIKYIMHVLPVYEHTTFENTVVCSNVRGGNVDGEVSFKDPDTQQCLHRYFVSHGKKHGQEIIYHTNGAPKESIPWKHGVISGTKYTWYSNGARESATELLEGKRVGETKGWYNDPHSSLMLRETYGSEGCLLSGEYFKINDSVPISRISNGCGLAYIFFEDGTLKHVSKYVNGVPVS